MELRPHVRESACRAHIHADYQAPRRVLLCAILYLSCPTDRVPRTEDRLTESEWPSGSAEPQSGYATATPHIARRHTLVRRHDQALAPRYVCSPSARVPITDAAVVVLIKLAHMCTWTEASADASQTSGAGAWRVATTTTTVQYSNGHITWLSFCLTRF